MSVCIDHISDDTWLVHGVATEEEAEKALRDWPEAIEHAPLAGDYDLEMRFHLFREGRFRKVHDLSGEYAWMLHTVGLSQSKRGSFQGWQFEIDWVEVDDDEIVHDVIIPLVVVDSGIGTVGR